MKRKILVTGGTGYIGSHTIVELINEGYEPVVIDNLSNSSASVIDRIKRITGHKPGLYRMDLTDEAQLTRFMEVHTDIEGIIHFAAYKAVSESVREPLKYYRNNLHSLINLLTAVRNRQMKFIFSSSCTVYGQPEQLPVTESSPVKTAESPYGNTKQIAEEILEETALAEPSLQAISLRYFNPVGAHPSALIGEYPIGTPQNLVPFVTQSASGKRGPLTIHGNDYPTTDGTCIRDYIHVVDLARAHTAALRYLYSNPALYYDVFNIGTGKGYSVLEVIRVFEKTTGVKLKSTFGPRRPGDIEKVWGEVSKAEKLLGWKAELRIEDMLASAWNWELSLPLLPGDQLAL